MATFPSAVGCTSAFRRYCDPVPSVLSASRVEWIGTLAAGIVIIFTGFDRADPIASLIVVALMLYAAWGLLRGTGRILLEAAPEGYDPGDIAAAITSRPGVASVHDVHVWLITSGGEHRCRRPGWPCGPGACVAWRWRRRRQDAARARSSQRRVLVRAAPPLPASRPAPGHPQPDPPHLQGGSRRHHRHLEPVGCLSAGGARERRMLAKASAGRTLTCCSGLWRTSRTRSNDLRIKGRARCVPGQG
jgi:hypothetical protein